MTSGVVNASLKNFNLNLILTGDTYKVDGIKENLDTYLGRERGFRVTPIHGPSYGPGPCSMDHCTDRSTDPPPSPLWTPPKKTIKMTIRDLTYYLSFVSWWQILTVARCKYCCGDKRRTYVMIT